MRAAAYTHTGPPEVIKISNLPEPLVQPNDILVQISHSALNPIDLYIRAGTINATLPNPFIPHADFAGTVKAVGSKVTRFRIGDKVWGSNQGMMGRQGTAAELASLNEDWAYSIPESVPPADAAACALTGITAHLGLFRTGQLQPGETVFVHGGTGGVGSMVIQMAKAHGSKVITTTGNSAKMDLCKSWGADLVLNYKTDDIAKSIKDFTNNQGVDLWYETQRDPSFETILPLMKMRGRVVVIAGRAAKPDLPFGIFYVRDLSIRGFAMFNATPDEQRVCATEMNLWMKTGKLKACIGKSFPLDQTSAAHQLLEENTLHGAGTLTGKVIIQVS